MLLLDRIHKELTNLARKQELGSYIDNPPIYLTEQKLKIVISEARNQRYDINNLANILLTYHELAEVKSTIATVINPSRNLVGTIETSKVGKLLLINFKDVDNVMVLQKQCQNLWCLKFFTGFVLSFNVKSLILFFGFAKFHDQRKFRITCCHICTRATIATMDGLLPFWTTSAFGEWGVVQPFTQQLNIAVSRLRRH